MIIISGYCLMGVGVDKALHLTSALSACWPSSRGYNEIYTSL